MCLVLVMRPCARDFIRIGTHPHKQSNDVCNDARVPEKLSLSLCAISTLPVLTASMSSWCGVFANRIALSVLKCAAVCPERISRRVLQSRVQTVASGANISGSRLRRTISPLQTPTTPRLPRWNRNRIMEISPNALKHVTREITSLPILWSYERRHIAFVAI